MAEEEVESVPPWLVIVLLAAVIGFLMVYYVSADLINSLLLQFAG